MSRIGKKPIEIPEGVEIKMEDNRIVVKGPKGELFQEVRPEIKVEIQEKNVIIKPQTEISLSAGQAKKTKAFWGLSRALISNMVQGVTVGYEKKLEMQGLGYKASLEGDTLTLNVGFSHPVEMKISDGVEVSVEKNIITITGINKTLVGQFAATIRKIKPPEPYKGKGIRYFGENVRRKVGKKATTTE